MRVGLTLEGGVNNLRVGLTSEGGTNIRGLG